MLHQAIIQKTPLIGGVFICQPLLPVPPIRLAGVLPQVITVNQRVVGRHAVTIVPVVMLPLYTGHHPNDYHGHNRNRDNDQEPDPLSFGLLLH
jgi:hypothetical protein